MSLFELGAVVGFNIDRKPNWDLIMQGDYPPEIIQVYPENLQYSQLISNYIKQCFPSQDPTIYSKDLQQLYPKHQTNNTLSSQIRSFQVQLSNGVTKHCFALTFFVFYCISQQESAFIQNVENLAGRREKVLSWTPQLEYQQLLNSRNPAKNQMIFNNYVQVYVEKAIVIACKQDDTGCEATLIAFVNTLLKQNQQRNHKLAQQYTSSIEQYGLNGEGQKYLSELLSINQVALQTENKLNDFQLSDLVQVLDQNHKLTQQTQEGFDDFEEDIILNKMPSRALGVKSEFNNTSTCIVQNLNQLNPLDVQIFAHPKDRLREFLKFHTISHKSTKKVIQNHKINKFDTISQVYTKQSLRDTKIQDFSFHQTIPKQKQHIFKEPTHQKILFKKL